MSGKGAPPVRKRKLPEPSALPLPADKNEKKQKRLVKPTKKQEEDVVEEEQPKLKAKRPGRFEVMRVRAVCASSPGFPSDGCRSRGGSARR